MCENNQHQFEARYDIKMPGPAITPECVTAEVATALKETIYVRDVCITCGKTIERQRCH